MAQLHNFDLTGRLGDITFYYMRGCKRPIARTKGGVSKKRILNDPEFDMTRRAGSEFGVRGKASGHIIQLHRTIRAWDTHLLVGELNARLDVFQKLDTVSGKGQRGVLFSKNPKLLEGTPLSMGVAFDSVVTTPLTASISRETLSAEVAIPAFKPGTNLFLPQRQPMYSLVTCLSLLPDFVYDEAIKGFKLAPGYPPRAQAFAKTDWFSTTEGSAPTTLALKVDALPPDQQFCLMLSVGIRLGSVRTSQGLVVEPVNNAGAAKILAMG